MMTLEARNVWSVVMWLVCDATNPLCCITSAVIPCYIPNAHPLIILGPILIHASFGTITVFVAKRSTRQENRVCAAYNPLDDSDSDDSDEYTCV